MTCDVPTVCRAIVRLGFTRKKLHRLALECDRVRADRFYVGMMLHHQPHQLIFLDETSKDMHSINRSYGYALRAMKPLSDLGFFSRGQRISTSARLKRWHVLWNSSALALRLLMMCVLFCMHVCMEGETPAGKH